MSSLEKVRMNLITGEQHELEQKLFKRRSYRLSKAEVTNILLGQHIEKYKNFFFSWQQAIASKFWTCLFRTLPRKKQKFVLLYNEGEDRIQNALDVRSII